MPIDLINTILFNCLFKQRFINPLIAIGTNKMIEVKKPGENFKSKIENTVCSIVFMNPQIKIPIPMDK